MTIVALSHLMRIPFLPLMRYDGYIDALRGLASLAHDSPSRARAGDRSDGYIYASRAWRGLTC